MKKLLLIAALPVLFSACKQPDPPASVTDPTATEAPVQRAPLPKGLVLDVPYSVVTDKWVDAEGERKRKVVVEFEQADVAAIGAAIKESMAAARYRHTSASEARGGERFNFRGDEGVRVSILVRPRGAAKPQNPNSTGSIEFNYTEPAGAPAPVEGAVPAEGQPPAAADGAEAAPGPASN